VITHAIFAQGLSVHAARISTRLDQVADVFYVTDADGRKIEDPAQIERIRQGLRQHIETFLGAIAA
jgi:[protein-PII] uridylyltransferase